LCLSYTFKVSDSYHIDCVSGYRSVIEVSIFISKGLNVVMDAPIIFGETLKIDFN